MTLGLSVGVRCWERFGPEKAWGKDFSGFSWSRWVYAQKKVMTGWNN